MSATLAGVLLLGALGAGWYLLRGRDKERPGHEQSSTPYPGVAIESAPGTSTCVAMRQFDGKRFLPHEAPILPLADCDIEHCNCCYVRYRDRRSESDRRLIDGANHGANGLAEQRHGPGRRQSDRQG